MSDFPPRIQITFSPNRSEPLTLRVIGLDEECTFTIPPPGIATSFHVAMLLNDGIFLLITWMIHSYTGADPGFLKG